MDALHSMRGCILNFGEAFSVCCLFLMYDVACVNIYIQYTAMGAKDFENITDHSCKMCL